MVASTVSRASYGIRFSTAFDASAHHGQDKIWDIHEGRLNATNQMQWYLKRVRIASKSHLIALSSEFFELNLWHTLNKTDL